MTDSSSEEDLLEISVTSSSFLVPPDTDIISSLPREVLLHQIIPFLGPRALISGLGSTSSTYREFCTSDDALRTYIDALFYLDTVPESNYFQLFLERMGNMKSASSSFWGEEIYDRARCFYSNLFVSVILISVVFVLGVIAVSVIVGFSEHLSRSAIVAVGLIFVVIPLPILLIVSLQCCISIEVWYCFTRKISEILTEAAPWDKVKEFQELEWSCQEHPADEEGEDPKDEDLRMMEEAAALGGQDEQDRLEVMMAEAAAAAAVERPRDIRRLVYEDPVSKEAVLMAMDFPEREKWQYRLLSSRSRLGHSEEFSLDSYAHASKWQLILGLLLLLPLCVEVALINAVIKAYITKVGVGAVLFVGTIAVHFIIMTVLFFKSCLSLCLCRRSFSETELEGRSDCFHISELIAKVVYAYVTEAVCAAALVVMFVPLSLIAEGVISRTYVPLALLPLWLGLIGGCIALFFVGMCDLANEIAMFLFTTGWVGGVIPIVFLVSVVFCCSCCVLFLVLVVLFYVNVLPSSFTFFAFVPGWVLFGIIVGSLILCSAAVCHEYTKGLKPPETEMVELVQSVVGGKEGEFVVRRAPRPVHEQNVTIM